MVCCKVIFFCSYMVCCKVIFFCSYMVCCKVICFCSYMVCCKVIFFCSYMVCCKVIFFCSYMVCCKVIFFCSYMVLYEYDTYHDDGTISGFTEYLGPWSCVDRGGRCDQRFPSETELCKRRGDVLYISRRHELPPSKQLGYGGYCKPPSQVGQGHSPLIILD